MRASHASGLLRSEKEVTMQGKILVAFATKYGSTQEVAEEIACVLREDGTGVELSRMHDVCRVDGYALVVLGAPLYMGRLLREARSFLKRNKEALTRVPHAVFALGPVGEEEGVEDGARKQLERALAKAPELDPVAVALFWGVIRPERMRFPYNRMPAGDWRDWDEIHRFAHSLQVRALEKVG
jgi:menaquinone-dependent protoporphyrinogen oxidase